jgi:hypothetical protein
MEVLRRTARSAFSVSPMVRLVRIVVMALFHAVRASQRAVNCSCSSRTISMAGSITLRPSTVMVRRSALLSSVSGTRSISPASSRSSSLLFRVCPGLRPSDLGAHSVCACYCFVARPETSSE